MHTTRFQSRGRRQQRAENPLERATASVPPERFCPGFSNVHLTVLPSSPLPSLADPRSETTGAHRPTFPRQYHQKVGRKRKIPSNHTGVGSPGAGDRSTDIDVDEFRSRSGSSYPRTGGRRPWTAAPHLGNSRGCGGGGEQNWWDRLARADQTKDQTKRHGGAVCGGGAEALGGELWGDADEV